MKYTKVLLHFTESPTKDECRNTWTNSNATIGSSISKFGTALELNNGSYIVMNDKIELGGQDFTIDFWGYMSSEVGYWARFFELWYQERTENNNLIMGRYRVTENLGVNVPNNSSFIQSSVVATYLNGVHHFAYVYQHSGSVFKVYVDGKLVHTLSVVINRLPRTLQIGKSSWSTDGTPIGVIDEFRVSDNIARWTEEFIPPTKPYTFIEDENIIHTQEKDSMNIIRGLNLNTQSHASTQHIDKQRHTLKINSVDGSKKNIIKLPKSNSVVKVSNLGGLDKYTKILLHFDDTVVDECNNTWSCQQSALYLDGTQYIQCTDTSKFGFPTTFTFELWIYPTAWDSPKNYNFSGFPLINRWGHYAGTYWLFNVDASQRLVFYSDVINGSFSIGSSSIVKLNQWQHVAATRDSSNVVRLFYNGTLVAQGTHSGSYSGNSFPFTIGASSNEKAWAIGYIREVVISNTCKYTSNFTPYPYQVTKQANTVGLLHFSTSTTTDDCGNTFTAYGSPSIVTMNAPFSFQNNAKFNKAFQFNGSVYLQMTEGFVLGGEDFTVDFWGFMSSSSGRYCRFFSFHSTLNNYSDCFALCRYSTESKMYFDVVGTTTSVQPYAVTLDVTHHYACIYEHDKTKLSLYIDGKLVFSWTKYIPETYFKYLWLGRSCYTADALLIGTIDEFRVSKGIARWTDEFDPPTQSYTL